MVQLYSWLNLRFSADLWFHHDDSSTIYQLQAEICCTFALEDDDIQGLEHFYWWYFRFRNQDANYVQTWMLQVSQVSIIYDRKFLESEWDT